MLPASGGNLSGGCNSAGSSTYDLITSGILLEHDFFKIHFIGWSPSGRHPGGGDHDDDSDDDDDTDHYSQVTSTALVVGLSHLASWVQTALLHGDHSSREVRIKMSTPRVTVYYVIVGM